MLATVRFQSALDGPCRLRRRELRRRWHQGAGARQPTPTCARMAARPTPIIMSRTLFPARPILGERRRSSSWSVPPRVRSAPNVLNVPRDPTLVFTFSEPVTVVGHWFDLITHDRRARQLLADGQRAFVDVTLNVDLLAGEVCNITVFKDQVHDQDIDDSSRAPTRCRGITLVVHGRQRRGAAVSAGRASDLRQSDECHGSRPATELPDG